MLPTAGAAAMVLAAAGQAHAAGIQVTSTTPAGATTTTPLTWDVTSTDPAATSCQLNADTGTGPVPVGALEACPFTGNAADPQEVSYAVPNAQPGIYTLTAYDAAVASVDVATTPSATSPTGIDVHPLAPSLSGPAGPSNVRQPAWTVSGIVAGATLDCSATGSVSGALPASCGAVDSATGQATATVDLSAATSDETVTLTVTQTANPATPAAETSTAATAHYALDITPPATLTPSPATSSSPNRKPTFSLTGGPIDATDTVTCAVSGGGLATTCTASTVKLDLTGLADGPYTLTVTVTDSAGNTSTATASYTLLPPRPVVTPAAASGNTDTVTVTITEPATDVTLTCVVTGPSATATLAPCQPGTNTLDLSTANDGTYTIKVTATDTLGLTSTGTATYSVDRAVTAPTVGLPAAASASGSGHTVAVTVTEPDTDGVTLSCSVSGPGAASLSGCGSSMNLVIAAGAGDGAYVVTVTATDALGNTSTGTATYTLVPPAPTTATPDKTSSAGSASWTMADAVSGVTYTCAVTGGPSAATASCASGSVVTLTLGAGAADGTYTVTVRAVDSLGNPGDPATLTYTLIPPAPTTPAASQTASDPNPSWDLSDSVAGVTYQCASTTGPATVAPTCGPTVLLNLTGKPLGTYTFVVRAVDALGHAGDPLTLTYTLVATAPTTATPTSSGSSRTPSWALSDAFTVTYQCTAVSGPAAFAPTCGPTVSLDLTGKPDGVYVVRVVPIDANGNAGDPLTLRYTLVPPAPTLTTGTTSVSSSSKHPSWSLTDAVAGVTYQCSAASGPASVPVSCGPTVSLDLTGAPDGVYSVTVVAVDSLGNAGDPLTLTDTLLPPAPTLTAGQATTTNSNRTPAWSLTDSVSGVTYLCTVVSGPASFTPACGATTSLNLSALADGTYVFTVQAVDSLGHAGDPLTITYTVIAPAPTTAAPHHTASAASTSWTVSDTEPVSSWLCSVSGPSAASVTCTGTTVTLTLSAGAADGDYVVTLRAVDAAGSGDPATLTYTLVPPAPTLTSGSVVTSSSDRRPAWGVTDAVAGVSYVCSVSGPVTLSAACGGPSVSLDLTGLPEGVYTITVRAVDGVGNAGDQLTLTYRLLAPAPTTTDPVAVTGSGGAATWTVTDTSPVTGWQCSVSGPAGSAPSVTCAGGVVHLTLGAGAPDGVYTVTVSALDGTGTAGDPLTLTDTLVPPAPTTGTPDGRGSSHLATWTMTDAVSPVTYSCALVSGPTTVGVTVTCTTASVKLSLPAGAADGVYTVTVRAVDALGHPGDPTMLTYTLVPPAPVSTSGPATASGSGRAPSWSLSDAVAGVTYQCSAVSGPAAVTLTCGPTVSFDLAGAPDGTYSVTVVAIDGLGNAGDPVVLSYTLVPPAPTLTAGSAVTTSSGRTPSWTVTDVISGVTYLCTPVSGPAAFTPSCGTTVSLNLSALTDGTYVFTVQAVDSLGHAGDPLTITYTVIPPAPTTATVHHTSSTGTTSWSVSDAQPVASWQCSVTGPSAATVTCSGSSVVLTLSGGAVDGDYTVVLRAVDAAGNAGDPLTLTYTLVPPAPTSTSGPATTSGAGQNPSWTLADTVAGVTYACSSQSGPATIPVTCGPTVSFDLSNAPDGTYSVVVVAVDSLGNAGDPLTLTYTLVPPPSSTATADQRGSSHTATWTVSNPVPGVTYVCTVTGPTIIGVTVTCPGGNVTLTLPAAAADGVYSISVIAVDINGNGGAPITLTYTLIPPAPTSNPAAVRSNASRTPSWTLTDTVGGVTYSCTVVSGPAAFTPTCGPTVSLSLTGLPDGVYAFTVVAVDSLGNAGDPLTISYTLLPPAPTVVSAPTSPASSHTPSWSLTDLVSGVTYNCSVSPSTGASVTCAGGVVQLTLSSGAADGTYTITVTVTDDLGNTGPARTLTYILIPPQPSVLSAPPASASSRTATWTVTDAVPGVTYTCSVAGASTVGASVTCAGGVLTLTLGATAVDGTYDVTVQAVDSFGRAGDPLTVHYTLIPPAPTTAQPTRSASDTAPSWALSDSVPGVTYTCVAVSGPTAFTPTCGATVSLSLGSAPDGTYVVSVQAVDSLGNAGDPLTLTYTLIPPAPTTAGPSRAASAPTVVWTLSDTVPGVTYLCGPLSGPGSGAVVTCGATVTLDVTGQPDGVYSFTVQAVDSLGNAGDPLTLTYTLVPTAPTTATPDQTASSLTPSWPVSDAVPGVTYVCTAVSGPAAFTPTCGPTVSLNLAGLPDGTYTLTVQAVDSVGSVGDPLTLTYTLIPPAPTTPRPTRVASGLTPSWALTDRVPGVSYVCTVVSGPAAFTPTCGPNVSLNLAGLPDGVYVLTVQAVDSLGHAGDPLTLSYTLIPPAPTTSAATTRGSSPTVSWNVADTVPGVSWLCTVVSGPVAFTPTCGPTVSLDLTGDPDGVYVLTVQAVDSLGNAGDPLTLTYTLIPPAPTTANPAQSSAGRKPAWPLSDAVPGVTYTCTTISGPVAFTPTCGSTVSLDLTGDPDGVYVLTVQAVDSLGNAGDPLTLTFTLIPPAPKLSGAVPVSPNNSRSPQWTVTDPVPGATYVCSVTGQPAGSTATVACATGAVTLSLAGQPDGLYTISVLAVDLLGNTSDPSKPLTFTYLLDTTAPVAPAVAVTPSPAQGVKVTYTISGIEPGGVLTCSLSAPAGSTLTVPAACGTTVQIDLTGQPDGAYVLSVTVTDAAGNTSVATSASYVFDTKPPAAPGVAVPAPTLNDVTPTLTVTTEPGATISCTVSRNLLPVAGLGCTQAGTIDLTGLADGEFEITVVSTDAAGNVSAGTTVTYLLDTVAPDAPVVTAPASPSPIVSPTWLWTGEPDAVATCTLVGPHGVVLGPVSCTSPFTFNFTGLPDGAYTLTVVLTDAAGNVSKPVATTFQLDRAAPVPPTVVPPASPDNTRSPAWTITGPRGAALTCVLLRGSKVVYGPGACPAGGVFSLANMPDGTYTLRVTATDAAGNVSAASVSTYVLDTHAPAAPTLDFASGSPSSSRTPNWGFTLPSGTTGHCELRNGSTLLASTSCRDAVSFSVPGVDGTYTLLVYAMDAAGNLSKPLAVSYVLVGYGGPGAGPSSSPSTTGSKTPPPPPPLRPEPVPPISVARQLADHLGGPANTAKKVASGLTDAASSVLPLVNDKLTKDVSSAVRSVVNAVSKAGGGTGFPLLLLVIVTGFLIVQSRIDRRDPKLALASVAADDTLQFRPPPSRGDFR
jgi:predicted phage tail protein